MTAEEAIAAENKRAMEWNRKRLDKMMADLNKLNAEFNELCDEEESEGTWEIGPWRMEAPQRDTGTEGQPILDLTDEEMAAIHKRIEEAVRKQD